MVHFTLKIEVFLATKMFTIIKRINSILHVCTPFWAVKIIILIENKLSLMYFYDFLPIQFFKKKNVIAFLLSFKYKFFSCLMYVGIFRFHFKIHCVLTWFSQILLPLPNKKIHVYAAAVHIPMNVLVEFRLCVTSNSWSNICECIVFQRLFFTLSTLLSLSNKLFCFITWSKYKQIRYIS